MHEVGAVRLALDPILRAWPTTRDAPRVLGFRIVDPTRADAESVRFLATLMLIDHGLPDVRVHVSMAPTACASCGGDADATPTDPTCRSCGAPVPSAQGQALECRVLEEAPCA